MNKNHYLIIILICIIIYNIFSNQNHASEGLQNLKMDYAANVKLIEENNPTQGDINAMNAKLETNVSNNPAKTNELDISMSDSKMAYSNPTNDSISYNYTDPVVLASDVREYTADYNAVEYHSKFEDEFNYIYTFDKSKNQIVEFKYFPVQNLVTYDPPGTYKYGLSSYVPTYTDSTLLSLH